MAIYRCSTEEIDEKVVARDESEASSKFQKKHGVKPTTVIFIKR